MKTKNSSSAPRDHTPGEVRYLNYYLEFPDGEVWSDYTHVVGGFHSWIERTALHKMNPDAAARLKTKGEYHWYVDHGAAGKVRHHMVLSSSPCVSNWGKSKKLEIVR